MTNYLNDPEKYEKEYKKMAGAQEMAAGGYVIRTPDTNTWRSDSPIVSQ
ncbi:MAG: hypothetical protein SV062_07425 [Thermodesulfobacteriota bacterium]|nr:hypothetical protein [Thermodesulfobacteriota bacterium]